MNKISIQYVLLMLFFVIKTTSFSQVSIQGEIRPRFEYRNGYKKLPDSTTSFAAFVSQRSRLYFNYRSSKITTKISFQDVRVWGDEALKTDVPDLGLYEAWVEFPVYDSLSLKIGKQEIAYDNERFFGLSNWSQQGNTHNAAMLKYIKKGLEINFTSALNQAAENTFGTNYSALPNNYKTLNILWISKKITTNLKASLLSVADGYQKANTTNTLYMRGTYGGIIEYTKTNENSAVIRGFYQDGRSQAGQKISAYYMSADLTYTLSQKFILWIGSQYVSGNNGMESNNKFNNAFNTLYGSGHRFSGNMDYFSNISTDTKGAGLVDPYLNMICKLNDKASARLDLHYLMLQNNYKVNALLIDKHLGEEADLSFTYNVNTEISLMAGFSLMKATKSMEKISGGDSNYPGTWGFVMLTFKPTFYKTEKQ